MLKNGLYELVISKAIAKELDRYIDGIQKTAPIDSAEASKILTKYISEIIEKRMDNVKDNSGNIQAQIDLANKIITTIWNETDEAVYNALTVDERAQQLLALFGQKNNIFALDSKAQIIRPETSIAQSSLFTGSIHEPCLYTEFKKEILSCDRIDMLVSFIKWSGLVRIIDELRTFTLNGGQLRVITTSYMGATDMKAIEELRVLPHTDIKVSYDTKRTRLHAKTYVFYRNTGFTTAYVGSSNLSNAAISSGLEWNVKVAAKELPDTIQKISATFESYWNSSEFEVYTVEQQEKLKHALRAEKYFIENIDQLYLFDISPYPYQQEILDKLDAERKIRGKNRNLVVAATGTGKTVISAFDYKRFCKENIGKPCRLLFVAHREEILKQSINCFKGVLRDNNFGDLFVGGYKPNSIDHLFMSIQTFNSQQWHKKTTPDFYNYIIIDEFHHAAAPSYQEILTYYQPQILLGLTATPERMDGKSILEYFDNRIAAEIRLPEAIDRKLLCPFQYFGVTDTIDLDSLKWTRGGYDKAELSKIYTLDQMVADKRCNMIIASILKYVTDINEVKGLGFCVSQEHAEYMANYFNQHNIPSMYLIADSPDSERHEAKNKLISGDVRFIFVVDLYNEGVDIPDVNTVLFLRPTESLTIFLQQLGRGLRLADNKECLTVLDFIGQANKKYNFENKFAALLSNTTRGVRREIAEGFVSVPKGCFIQLERKAKEYVLENISNSFDTKFGLITRIASFEEDSGLSLSLENFIDYYHLDTRSIYIRDNFSRLCVLAGVRDDFFEPIEQTMTKAFSRICAIDSRRWITFLLKAFDTLDSWEVGALSDGERRMLQMFQFTVWQNSVEACGFTDIKNGLKIIKDCPVLYKELIELLKYNYSHIDFIDQHVDLGFDCPLDVHCQYTRDQIFVALDYLTPGAIRQGVKWLPDKKLDVFINTLNKAEKDYSPTTMYNDYSINEWLFHWQSQSTTSESSPTGQRYIHHATRGSKVLLFVREYNEDIAGTAPFTFLGIANYVKHDGSCPMNITWKLEIPIPAKFIKKTNKLVVG
ncbi:MAG: type I restriction enzyme EcoKI subunit R [Firmicutes bacterium ADurb.Bin182]|nr:MAG: type I restriction enzyme EcoKI subunit R [Firmicutes bacterium ADurb.Bin182]